jgi:hypothetical protein
MIKTCGKCKIEKTLDKFSKGTGKYNTSSTCKECHNIYRKKHYLKNRQKYLDTAKRHHLNNSTRKQEYDQKRRREKSEELRAYDKFRYERDKKKRLALARKWATENPERRKQINKKWRKENPDYCRMISYARMKQEQISTPKWLTPEQLRDIKAMYSLAVKISKETGIPHQVDHIYPLKGVNSCGLTVPWNLRIITAKENMLKGNKLPTDI